MHHAIVKLIKTRQNIKMKLKLKSKNEKKKKMPKKFHFHRAKKLTLNSEENHFYGTIDSHETSETNFITFFFFYFKTFGFYYFWRPKMRNNENIDRWMVKVHSIVVVVKKKTD